MNAYGAFSGQWTWRAEMRQAERRLGHVVLPATRLMYSRVPMATIHGRLTDPGAGQVARAEKT